MVRTGLFPSIGLDNGMNNGAPISWAGSIMRMYIWTLLSEMKFAEAIGAPLFNAVLSMGTGGAVGKYQPYPVRPFARMWGVYLLLYYTSALPMGFPPWVSRIPTDYHLTKPIFPSALHLPTSFGACRSIRALPPQYGTDVSGCVRPSSNYSMMICIRQ